MQPTTDIQINYFQQRCQDLNFDPAVHTLNVPRGKAVPGSEILRYPLLEEHQSGGISIPVYTLEGDPAVYDKNINKNNAKAKFFEIVRLHPDVHAKMVAEAEKLSKKEPGKYLIPTGAKSLPWIAPNIIEAYRKKEKINTIVLTEGYFKGIAGWLNGLYMFGLTSITGYKDKDTGTLHESILRVIKECQVENVILLYDGDCADISLKALSAGKDLYKRPAGFFNSARAISELLKDMRTDRHFDVYFAHPNTKDLDGHPKGLDDLFLSFKNPEDPQEHPINCSAAVKELTSFSKQKPYYFTRFNITVSIYKVLEHLKIQTHETFYTAHNQIIGEKPFVYHGTKWQWDSEAAELKIIVPGAAKNYIRVGDDYFEKIFVPNEIGLPEFRLARRSKSTITDDHGKKIVDHIQKFKAFFVKPDHVNYQEVIDGCYNSYKPFEHTPSNDPDCPRVLNFLGHIFGDQIDLGLDYIQLLYQKPTEKLPILSLVSKEQKTGKTTFLEFLKAIFTGNMAMIGNDQLESNFNGSWTDKLIVACEESFIEKKRTVEKIKALSTGKRAEVERKGIDSSEISFFAKFILNSNNETNFTLADETDTRYWVRKIPPVQNSDPNLLADLIEEIPNFLCFLNQRKLSVPKKEDRMWFAFWRIKTEAFKKLVEANKAGPQRELITILRSLFTDTGFWRLEFTLKYIHETLFKSRYSKEYIEKLLHDKFHKKTGTAARIIVPELKMMNVGTQSEEHICLVKIQGRPYTFEADEFLSEQDILGFKLSEAAINAGQEEFAPEEVKKRTIYGQNSVPVSIPNDDLPF